MNSINISMIRLIGVGLVTLAISITGVANAGDASNGEKLSTEKGCVGCHAVDGNSVIPTNPILAGQYEDYLIQALQQYQSGDRKNPIMSGFAAALSEKDIADLAAWFSSNDSKLQYVK